MSTRWSTIAELLLFLVEELLELVGVRDVDFGVDLRLLHFDGAVEQRHVGVLDREGHVLVDALFVDDDALDELGLVDGAADDLLDGDVVRVDAVVVLNREDGVDDEFGEEVLEFSAPLPVIAVSAIWRVSRSSSETSMASSSRISLAFSAA